MQEVPPPERNASVRIPLFRPKEVTSVVKKHFLDAWVEDDRGHRSFVPTVCPTPGAVRIRKVDLNAVNSFSFVFLLGLQDKLFQDGVVACNHTAR